MKSRRNTYPVFGYLLAVSGLLLLAGCAGEQDQAVADYAIAYIKRPIPIDPDATPEEPANPDVRQPSAFNEGGDLDADVFDGGGDVYIRDRASPSASERNITSCITGGTGDVKDLEASFEGDKLIFALRLEDPTPNDLTDPLPTWNIYEYDVASGACPTRVIEVTAHAEDGDDVAPAYLPGGRIVFSSSRQHEVGVIQSAEGAPTQFSPLDEDRDQNTNQHAMNLHVMNLSGRTESIRQLSFNQSHDLDPSVLASGEILFSRWDHMGGRNSISLYKIRPDGTELKAVYGLHDHDVGTGGSTVQFLSPRELENGRILGMIKPFTGSRGGGAPVVINATQFADNTQPTWPYEFVATGNGQVNAVSLGVTTDGSISPAGRFRSVYPLWDGSNRALVSWSQCRLEEADGDIIPCPDTIPANATEAFPLYGIYIYDLGSNTQLPVVIPEEGMIIEEPVVLAPRTRPAILIDKGAGVDLDQSLMDEYVGLLHIRSVYDMDGKFYDLNGNATIDPLVSCPDPNDQKPCLDIMSNPDTGIGGTDGDNRPARFLRLIKGAYFPDENIRDIDLDTAFGVSAQQGMREILGYATVEPDGSVLVKVPANVPFAISVVDKDGRRVVGTNGLGIAERHQNWLQVRPGEVLECNGCHDHTPPGTPAPNAKPHGYADGPTTVVNTGAGTTGVIFTGTTTDIDPDPIVVEEILPNMGETMAQARFRSVCGEDAEGALGIDMDSATCPLDLVPNINPNFFDIWANGAIPDKTDLSYTELDPPLVRPTNADSAFCQPISWEAHCRIVINYEAHIHPLWAAARAGGACTDCHDVMGAITAGQLDLSDGPSDLEPDHFKAYRELLSIDIAVDAAGNPITQDATIPPLFNDLLDPITGLPVLDPITGLPVPDLTSPRQVDVTVPPSMSTNGARSSNRFFSRFYNFAIGDTVDHTGFLTPAEIRLLSEWLDIGAQYYNRPFDAP